MGADWSGTGCVSLAAIPMGAELCRAHGSFRAQVSSRPALIHHPSASVDQ